MSAIFWIIISTSLISLCALVGVFTLSLKDETLNKILLKLVALSSGAMLGAAFLHLMPEGTKELGAEAFFPLVLIAIIFYLLVEKFFHWRHCHKKGCETHNTLGYMNLVGDSVHNFIDGLVIAGAFIVDIRLGLVTAAAMAAHEIPQEIGDFGVLLYSGFAKKRALLLNFLVALTTVVGGLAGWVLSRYSIGAEKYLLPLAAGGFIYIAVSDLLPELRKEIRMGVFAVNFLIVLAGAALIYVVGLLGG